MVVSAKLPDLPVIVTVDVPGVAAAPAVNVKVLLVVVGFFPNAAVTALGRPDADKVTSPLKPFNGVMVMVLVPLPVCERETLFGLAESV